MIFHLEVNRNTRISSGNQEMEVVSWSLVRFLRFLWFYSVCRGYRLSHIHMCTQSHVYTYVYIHMSVWVIPCHMYVFSSTESS